jgi:hypothetical protein
MQHRLIIWRPEGNYKNLLRTFCSMRDQDLLNIQSSVKAIASMLISVQWRSRLQY